MSLSRDERTTTINYDDGTDFAIVTTYSKPLINSLEKNGAAKKVREYPEGGVEFRIPKKLVNIRNARAPRREMTDEERAAARDRLMNARQMRGRKPVARLL